MKADQRVLVSDACELIKVHYGEELAEMYRDFYKDKQSSDIIVSAQELLAELIGENRAKSETEMLLRKHKL